MGETREGEINRRNKAIKVLWESDHIRGNMKERRIASFGGRETFCFAALCPWVIV